MNFCIIYCPCSSKKEAEVIVQALLEERLIACANITDNVTSLYWWEGEIQKDSEVVMLAKTKKTLFSQLEKRIKELHSYDCPCIVQIDIQQGNREYLEWLGERVTDSK